MIDLPVIIGDYKPRVHRHITGMWSLDNALRDIRTGQIGLPLQAVIEIYGKEQSGKSTLAWSIAGCIRPDGRVAIMDTEHALDIDYLPIAMASAGFAGEIEIISPIDKKENPRHHASMATELADCLTNEQYQAIILDSVGMYRAVAEEEGDIGDANMGRRARDMAQFTRRCLSHLITYPTPKKIALLVNHRLEALGPGAAYSPGGRTKSYGNEVKLYMFRKDSKFEYGAFQAELKVDKLRKGGTDRERKGTVFIIPGVGVAKGMTALMDCLRLGEAERSNFVKVKVGDKMESCGYRLKQLVEADMDHNQEPFAPFHKIIEGYYERASADLAGDGEVIPEQVQN